VLLFTLIFSICIAFAIIIFARSPGIATGSWGQVEAIFMFARTPKTEFLCARCEIKSYDARKIGETVYNTVRRFDAAAGDFGRTPLGRRKIKQTTSHFHSQVCHTCFAKMLVLSLIYLPSCV